MRDQRQDRLHLCFIESTIADRLSSLSLLTVIRGLTRVPEANDLVRFLISRDRLTIPSVIPLLALPTLFHHIVGRKLQEPVLCVYIDVPPKRIVQYSSPLGLNASAGVTRTEAGFQLSLWGAPSFARVPLSLQPIPVPDGVLDPPDLSTVCPSTS